MKRKLSSAFTIVELMVVLFVLGMFAAIITIAGFIIHYFW